MSKQDDHFSALTQRAEQAEAELNHTAYLLDKVKAERDKAEADAQKNAEAWAGAADERDANRTEIERLKAAKAQAEAERDALIADLEPVKAIIIAEVKALRARAEKAEASHTQLVSALREQVEAWREGMGVCKCSIHCDCDASGYQACADDLDQLLAPSSACATCSGLGVVSTGREVLTALGSQEIEQRCPDCSSAHGEAHK